MNWYMARRLMACRVKERLTSFEESFFVVGARDQQQAEYKALDLALLEEHSYKNPSGEMVTWKLDRLIDISRLVTDDFSDGTWLYSRSYPRLSRLAERSTDKLRLTVNETIDLRHSGSWYGAMLLFRITARPAHDEERLVLIQGNQWDKAAKRALSLARLTDAESKEETLLGLFGIFEIHANTIESGTEVYSRFYRPSELKDKNRPPRETHLTIPEFMTAERRHMRVSA